MSGSCCNAVGGVLAKGLHGDVLALSYKGPVGEKGLKVRGCGYIHRVEQVAYSSLISPRPYWLQYRQTEAKLSYVIPQ